MSWTLSAEGVGGLSFLSLHENLRSGDKQTTAEGPTGGQPLLGIDNLSYQNIESELCENKQKDQGLVNTTGMSFSASHLKGRTLAPIMATEQEDTATPGFVHRFALHVSSLKRNRRSAPARRSETRHTSGLSSSQVQSPRGQTLYERDGVLTKVTRAAPLAIPFR